MISVKGTNTIELPIYNFLKEEEMEAYIKNEK